MSLVDPSHGANEVISQGKDVIEASNTSETQAMDSVEQLASTVRQSTSLQELFAPLSVPADVQPSRSSSLSSFDLSTLTAERSGTSKLDRRLAQSRGL